ncbi:MAG TPA: TIGR03435 family protein [Verrucomicrobiae bacterium]|nr:TIGR03435 family protein [Verrucomicrobiae bacterium]
MTKGGVIVMSALGWIATAPLYSQAAAAPEPKTAAPPVFDVAVIKPTDPTAPRNGCFMKGQPGGQTFIGRCIPVRLIIKRAYLLIDDQISGGPGWMDNELFDFDAKTDRSVTRAQIAEMFQRFLADRFHLQFHLVSRVMPAFTLTVDKAGSKMKKNESSYEWEIPVQGVPGPVPKIKGVRCPMNYFSWYLGQTENRPVVDQTGLSGFWDFTLEFVPDALQNRRGRDGEPIAAPDGPNLATALREQLGLKLEPAKTPVDVYVIDRLEKPVN